MKLFLNLKQSENQNVKNKYKVTLVNVGEGEGEGRGGLFIEVLTCEYFERSFSDLSSSEII